MTGSWAMADRNFLPFMLVRYIAKANMKPTMVEVVAVQMPRRTEPQRACRLEPDKDRIQVSREKWPSLMKDRRRASPRGKTMKTPAMAARISTAYPRSDPW
jgi:hypothetical protein